MVEIVESVRLERDKNLKDLRKRLAILKSEWDRLEVCESEVAHSPFDILTDQVERVIVECGLTLDKDRNSDSTLTMGDANMGMYLVYCSQRILVITSFRSEYDHYEDGELMVTSMLDGIRVVDLDEEVCDH